MHRMIVRYALLIFKWYQNLAYNVDLTRYLVFVFCKSYLTNHGAKDVIIDALRLISHFKGPSLTPQHHLVDITLSQLQFMDMCKLQSKLFAHMQGGQMLPMRVHETCPNPLHMVKMLGQATWIQLNFNSYLCERIVINYKKGEIESSSLVLMN